VFAVKPFGPVQLYVAPATKLEVRLMLLPAHNVAGKAFKLGAAGAAFTTTEAVVAVGAIQLPTEATTE